MCWGWLWLFWMKCCFCYWLELWLKGVMFMRVVVCLWCIVLSLGICMIRVVVIIGLMFGKFSSRW